MTFTLVRISDNRRRTAGQEISIPRRTRGSGAGSGILGGVRDPNELLAAARAIEEEAAARVAALRAKLQPVELELDDLEIEDPPPPPRPRPRLPGLPPPRTAIRNPSTPPPPFQIMGRVP